MKCPTCQHELPDTTLMCPYCGYAKCEPPSDVPHLLAELQRLLTYFSNTTEPLHKERIHLRNQLNDEGEFIAGLGGCAMNIFLILLLFITWGILMIFQFFHIKFAILMCSFIEKYMGWNNLFWFCILAPTLFNIITKIRLRIKKRRWRKELAQVYQDLDTAFIQAPNNFIEFKYARVSTIKILIRYIQERRATSYQEALNLYVAFCLPDYYCKDGKYYEPFY